MSHLGQMPIYWSFHILITLPDGRHIVNFSHHGQAQSRRDIQRFGDDLYHHISQSISGPYADRLKLLIEGYFHLDQGSVRSIRTITVTSEDQVSPSVPRIVYATPSFQASATSTTS